MKPFLLTLVVACLLLLFASPSTVQTATAAPEPTAPPAATTPVAPDAESTPAPASIAAAKEVEIRKMLAANGTEKLMNQMKTQMFDIFRKRQPNVPAKTWDRLEQEMNTHELLEKLIPLYDKYLTLDDLKAANVFYASPAGQHISEQLPKIMAESNKISQEWGRQVALKVMIEALKEEGAPPSGETNAPTAK